MRYSKISFGFLTVSSLMFGCGSVDDQSYSKLTDDPRRGRPGRFEAPEVLETLTEAPANTELGNKTGASAAQLDAAFENLHRRLRVDPVSKNLQFTETAGVPLSGKQVQGLTVLKSSYAQRLREGAIKLMPDGRGSFAIVSGEGQNSGIGIGPRGDIVIRPPVIGDSTFNLTGSVAPDHRTGDGRWSWQLSYKWWGVRLYVNHNFLNYLCHNTDWMLSRAGLPGWIKFVIRPLGCLLHALDSGANGSSISITWAGAFWYSA